MNNKRWVGGRSQGLTDISFLGQHLEDQTVRVVLHAGLGGVAVRVRFSNRFGRQPLRIGAAHIALAGEAATILPGTGGVITFAKQREILLAPGTEVISDLVDLAVQATSAVALSYYLPQHTPVSSGNLAHISLCTARKGEATAAAEFPPDGLQHVQLGNGVVLPPAVPFFAALDVLASADAGAIVAFGDSITASGWPEMLAERLATAGLNKLSVLNQGISGNRILRDGAGPFGPASGPAGVTRFACDALAQPGVAYVLVLEGINDLIHPGDVAPAAEEASATDLIGGLRLYIEQGHRHGVKMIGGTLLPFAGYHAWNPVREEQRQLVNRWISKGEEFDAVFDADAALRDPAQPACLLNAYDSGDHLHPGPAGLRAIADSIRLQHLSRIDKLDAHPHHGA